MCVMCESEIILRCQRRQPQSVNEAPSEYEIKTEKTKKNQIIFLALFDFTKLKETSRTKYQTHT